jgi:O-antigen biosynthesis protein
MSKKVAIFTNSPWDGAISELRLRWPLEAGGFKVFSGNELIGNNIFNQEKLDYLVFQRDFPKNWTLFQELINTANRLGISTIYDIDDLLWELPENHPERKNYAYLDSLVPMLAAVSQVDMVTVSTPLLVEYLKPKNPNIYLLPNYINDQLWKMRYLSRKKTNSLVTMGYMGSFTHEPDLILIQRVLEKLINEYKDILTIELIGMQIPKALQGYKNIRADEKFSVSYKEFIERMNGWNCDISISPLINNQFNRSKSPIKYLEYSINGIPGVYSRIDPYIDVITDPKNGLLAETEDEWYQSLKLLIENPTIRYQMGLAAQENVRENYLLSDHVSEWENAYDKAIFYCKNKVKNDSDTTIRTLVSIANQYKEKMDDLAQYQPLEEHIEPEPEQLNSVKYFLKLKNIIIPQGSIREKIARNVFSALLKINNYGIVYLIKEEIEDGIQILYTKLNLSNMDSEGKLCGKQSQEIYNDENKNSISKVLDLIDSSFIIPESSGMMFDIIIPVYNGFEYLPELFSNIFSNTTEPYRLIIIDDNSTDPRVWQFLKTIQNKRDGTVLIKNSENRGFIYTVNVGIAQAQHDFVILNTDVIMPPNWLERLMYPIISDQKVASTTPFTNSGTICSFPNYLCDNQLFDGLTLTEIDEVFQRIKPEQARGVIPTGVGFCMGMNIKVIKEIGDFDQKTFTRGYGEENDWCMRANKMGYTNIFVENLFVYHKHGGSFSNEEKKSLMTENIERLRKKHPEYERLVQDYVARDPLKYLRCVITLMLAIKSSKKGINLIVDHGLGGGTAEFHKLLEMEMREKDIPVINYCEYYDKVDGLFQVKFRAITVSTSITTVNEIIKLAQYVKIDKAYYNNSVSFRSPLGIPKLLMTLKIVALTKITIAVHDYFVICPSFNLLNKDGKYCGIPTYNVCEECLPENKYLGAPRPVDIYEWRDIWRRCLQQADEIICFSNSSIKLLTRAYPSINIAKTKMQPHRVDYLGTHIPKLYSGREIRIGVVGVIIYSKGAEIIEEMSQIISKDKIPISIHIIGEFEGYTDPTIVSVSGPYKKEDLPEIIEKIGISVFFFPSIVSETFSYVTEELIEMQVPVAAFNIGAPAERLIKYSHGKLIEKIDPQDALDTLMELFKQSISTLPNRYES